MSIITETDAIRRSPAAIFAAREPTTPSLTPRHCPRSGATRAIDAADGERVMASGERQPIAEGSQDSGGWRTAFLARDRG